MQDYRKLKVWKETYNFTKEIYRIINKFPENEKYAMTSQLRRASVSIGLNISEGTGRRTQKDFVKFLYIAIGSASEVEYLLLLSKDFGYINNSEYEEIDDKVKKIRSMLINLIKSVTHSA